MAPGLVRLSALIDSRVKVPDLADTVGPVSERNCLGAIPPGGEPQEESDLAVTPWRSNRHNVNSIRPAVLAEPASATASSPNKIVLPALREWNASGREPQMVGDGMWGSSRDVNQGTTAGGDARAGRGQSVRSSAKRVTTVEQRDVGRFCPSGRLWLSLLVVMPFRRSGNRGVLRVGGQIVAL